MAINHLQMWADLSKEADKQVKLEGAIQHLAGWMNQKKSFQGSYSDIMVI